MDPLGIALVSTIIILMLIVITVLVTQRGQQPHAFEKQISSMQTELVELRAQAQARQSDSQTLATGLNEVRELLATLRTQADAQYAESKTLVGYVDDVKVGLTRLQSYIDARKDVERQTMDSIRRLESVIAGTQSKGIAGENILEMVFSRLPPDWQLRNFTIGNKTVEFALRLPNNLVLPIDSKWTATSLLEKFAATDDVDEQRQLRKDIEKQVLDRAEEVRKYLDPNLTTTFGIAVVPDAVYDLCVGVHAEAFRLSVVLISYSLFVPYLLLVFQTILKASQTIDTNRLMAYLHDVEEHLGLLQDELEGRFDKALKMLNNSRSDMSAHLSRVRGGLTSLQLASPMNEVTGEQPPTLLQSPENALSVSSQV